MKRLGLLVSVALLLCLLPLAYTQAADVTGKFTVPAAAPSVTALQIYEDLECTQVAEAMDPQMEYYARATVELISKLKHLKEVKVYIYYDATGNDGEPGSPNPQTCAILTWTAGPPDSWSIDAGGSTTWSIVSDNCRRPVNLDVTSGDWVFAFIPGKVATETDDPADWDGKGTATNKNNKTGAPAYVRDKAMNFYGEVIIASGLIVDWGEVDPGLMFTDDPPNPKTNIEVTYIANGEYNATIRGKDWDGEVNGTDAAVLDEDEQEPPTGANEFALKANDEDVLDSAVWVKKSENNNIRTDNQTVEDGTTVPTNTLWLSLSEEFEPDVYSGAIYYGIANGD